MKITVYRMHEIEISFDEIIQMKMDYEENPELHYDFNDEMEFIEFLETNYDYVECDDFLIEKEDYKKFLEKWNEM